MNGADYVKGICRKCGGHLEFPSEAAGQQINCPHCGQTITLFANVGQAKVRGNASVRRPWRLVLGVTGLIFVISGVAVGLFLRGKNIPVANPEKPVAVVTSPTPAKPPLARATNAPAFKTIGGTVTTNAFAFNGLKMQKTEGTSLVYATGRIQNLTAKQRFGVKVELNLFDAKKELVGKATDYQPEMDPHSVWTFKALVIEDKAISAKLDVIKEDQ